MSFNETNPQISIAQQRANIDLFTESLLENLRRKLEGQPIDHEQLNTSVRAVGDAVRESVGTITPSYMAAALMSYGEAINHTFALKMQEEAEGQARVITEEVIDRIATSSKN